MAKQKKETKTKAGTKPKRLSSLGYKNAEKWTEDVVMEYLEKMIIFIETPKTVVGATKIRTGERGYDEISKTSYYPTTISEACLHLRRPEQWYYAMAKKFKDNPLISESFGYIKDRVRQNVIEATESGAIKTQMGILNLTVNYGWVTERLGSKVDETQALQNLTIHEDDEGFDEIEEDA